LRYLLVDSEGKIHAEFETLAEAAEEPGLSKLVRRARGRLKLVRVDDWGDGLVSASSFVTATPLPEVLRERPHD